MALTKETIIDQITVTEIGIVLVREATSIKDDEIEISKHYHRISFEPGNNVSSYPSNVQEICAAAWTPELIAAYQQQKLVKQIQSDIVE